jgi:hypothetical protein
MEEHHVKEKAGKAYHAAFRIQSRFRGFVVRKAIQAKPHIDRGADIALSAGITAQEKILDLAGKGGAPVERVVDPNLVYADTPFRSFSSKTHVVVDQA